MPASTWAFRLKTLLLCFFIELCLIFLVQSNYDCFDLGMGFFESLFLLRNKFWGSLLAVSGQMSHLPAFETSPFSHQFSSFVDCHCVNIHSIRVRSRPEIEFSHSIFIFLSWGFPSWSGYFAVPNLPSMMNFRGLFVPVCQIGWCIR